MHMSQSLSHYHPRRPFVIVAQPRDSDGEDLLLPLRHLRHHHLHPARHPVNRNVDRIVEDSSCENEGRHKCKAPRLRDTV